MDYEDDIVFWQDILDAIRGQRRIPPCPFCGVDTLEVSKKERVTRVRCQNKECRRYIEGDLGDDLDHVDEMVKSRAR